jgi:hypothetical protein
MAKYNSSNNVISMLKLDGGSQKWQGFYVNGVIMNLPKIEEKIKNLKTIDELKLERQTILNKIPEVKNRAKAEKKFDKYHEEEIENAKKFLKPGESLLSDKLRECYRNACLKLAGELTIYFNTAFGFSEFRGMLIAGPFGDGGRTEIPLWKIPDDGTYIRIEDAIKATINGKEYIDIKECEKVVFDIKEKIMQFDKTMIEQVLTDPEPSIIPIPGKDR